MKLTQKSNVAIYLIVVTLTTTSVSCRAIEDEKLKPNITIRRELKSKMEKAFESWDRSKNPFPCIPEKPGEESNIKNEGIFYIKVPKTSSSDLARITDRIAGREAKRQGFKKNVDDPTICKIHDPMIHNRAFDLNVSDRDKSKSFVWSIIRHPEDRAISHFAMNCRNKHVDPTPEGFLDELKRDRTNYRNIQLMFLNPLMNMIETKGTDYELYVSTILNEFNFVGLYERHSASLVLLSMIIGGDVSDAVYDLGMNRSRNSRCGSTERPAWALDPVIEAYFESREWRDNNKGEYMLYEAVERSMDLTIERLGRENFERKLNDFEKLLQIGSEAARKTMNVDAGCGIPGLHPVQNPYADLKDLYWLNEISSDDREFIKRPEFIAAYEGGSF